jgi:hypothetical protein
VTHLFKYTKENFKDCFGLDLKCPSKCPYVTELVLGLLGLENGGACKRWELVEVP